MNPSESVPRRRSRCYRIRRSYLFVGIIALVIFTAMGVGSVATAWWNIDGSFAHPKAAALVFGVFWTAWVLLSLWLLAAYFCERLRLGPSAITRRGVFRIRRVRLHNVSAVVWRWYPAGGSVVVRTPVEQLKIEFANFTRSEQGEIVSYLREAIPKARQEGWEKFVASVRTPRNTSR